MEKGNPTSCISVRRLYRAMMCTWTTCLLALLKLRIFHRNIWFYSLFIYTKKVKKINIFHSTSNLFALSIITDQAGPGSFWGCFSERGARRAGKKDTEIYHNQIRLWSELKEDVKMESMLNVAWFILSRGIWTLRALSVGCEYPPCCFSARSCSETQWAEHGTNCSVVRG